jgi:hypothetical protein
VTTALADAEVLAIDGTPTKLGTLWTESPAVLVFLRHFG